MQSSCSATSLSLCPPFPPVHSLLCLRVGVNRAAVEKTSRRPQRTQSKNALACPSMLHPWLSPKRTHSLALRACTRWRVLHTSTQREQADWAFRAPRFRSLTDPLACASSLYALPRPPYKHAARASGLGVSGASFPVLNGPTRLRFELVRAAASSIQARSASKWIGRFGPCRTPRRSRAYGVRELVTAFWSTAARKHPSSRVPISNSDLRSPIPWFSTFVVPASGGFPSSLAQDKNHERHETHEKQSGYRTGGRRGNGDVPCNDECRKSNDERSPKSQIDASPTALARDCQLSNANCQLPTANCQLTR